MFPLPDSDAISISDDDPKHVDLLTLQQEQQDADEITALLQAPFTRDTTANSETEDTREVPAQPETEDFHGASAQPIQPPDHQPRFSAPGSRKRAGTATSVEKDRRHRAKIVKSLGPEPEALNWEAADMMTPRDDHGVANAKRRQNAAGSSSSLKAKPKNVRR